MTNGDRIRQMTDEQIVDILDPKDCVVKTAGFVCPMLSAMPCDCKAAFLKWLKQEVQVDDKR